MPGYWNLKYKIKSSRVRTRTIARLKDLRSHIDKKLPIREVNNNLVLGTWNIRNFDNNTFGHGPRLKESLFYIAEIISAFDIVAVQEINDDLRPLDELMGIIGTKYDYLVTDVTDGSSGNNERLGFIFDKSKVSFKGIAGEVVLKKGKKISSNDKDLQFARTPFTCAFQAGWFKFMFSTVHIYYGESSKTSVAYKRRVAEIHAIASFLANRSKKGGFNQILVGDFNIDALGDSAAKALSSQLKIFKNREGSNKKQNKYYDQISFLSKKDEVQLAQTRDGKEANGVFNVFACVFKDQDFTAYKQEVNNSLINRKNALLLKLQKTRSVRKKEKYNKGIANIDSTLSSNEAMRDYYLNEWRTFQMSDHFPLWVVLETDFSDKYLDSII
jgi:endonuclease/exonuclease/phosphatase family metal-dependent hydrolase